MSVYVISDPHFGHKNILKFRDKLPFSTVAEHDEFIMENILKTVRKRDKLIILGDVCFSKDSLSNLKTLIERIEVVEIILGNHDNENNQRPSLIELTKVIGNNIYGMKKYKNVWLTHAPIHPEELRGKFNIHGHTHGFSLSDPRYFNACCDVLDYKPIEFTKIVNALEQRSLCGENYVDGRMEK